MKSSFLIVFILTVSEQCWCLVCPTTTKCNATITKMCMGNDVDIMWPDYENVHQYFRCQGEDKPISESCYPNFVFNFYTQKCTKCEDYIPAPCCQTLKGKAKCTTFQPTESPTTTPASMPPCNELRTYDTTFVPTCLENDVYFYWPNYKNVSEYYWCQGAYNAKIKSCVEETYFNYYAQKCTDCNSYVPAPECKKMPFHKSNKCVKI